MINVKIINIIVFSMLISANINVPADYSSIQEAIDASLDGDVITVSAGTYNEGLNLTKAITLNGDPGAIIDATQFTNGILIGFGSELDGYVDGVEVNGFEILGGLNTMSGIQVLPGSKNITIQNNIIHGMRLPNSTSTLLASYGILSWGISNSFRPENIIVSNNEIYDTRALGISFGSYSRDITITNNNIHDIVSVDLANSGYPNIDLSVGINAQYANNISISNNTFDNVITAISQTWVGEVSIDANVYNNVDLFYTVDEYSYETVDNIELDIDSFGSYLTATYTLSSDTFPTPVVSLGWFSDINDAIGTADEGSQVLMSRGTFNQNIIWPSKNIELIGAGIDSTIINADSGSRAIIFQSSSIDDDSIIKNMTIQNGNGGILIDGSSPTIDSCKIIDNIAVSEVGGGIKIVGAGQTVVDPIISNSIIINNQSVGDESISGGGAGIYITTGATPIISNNLIAFNSATIGSAKGSGIMCYYASPSLENNTIYGNTSWVYSDGDSSSIAGGIYLLGNSNPTIDKTIVWGNSNGALIVEPQSNPTVTYSNIEGSYSDVDLANNGSNINSNPLFCDIDNLDFSLADNSPCSLGTLEFIGAYNTGGCGDIVLDCNGVPGGTALEDECGECVDGDTGLTACVQDCLGVWGGTHYVNSAGDCCNYSGTECLDIADNLLPFKFDIVSIAPNPFNPSTNIEYSISSYSNIKINIYDISGSLIKTLVDEFRSPGIYSADLKANSLPSGNYILTLDSNEGNVSRLITVVK